MLCEQRVIASFILLVFRPATLSFPAAAFNDKAGIKSAQHQTADTQSWRLDGERSGAFSS